VYSDLQLIQTLRTAKSNGGPRQQPRGIVFTDDILLVVNKDINYRIVQFSCKEGKQLALFGGYGQHNGEFNEPTMIACNKGKVYIVDWQNYRMQVFNDNLYFDYNFGTRLEVMALVSLTVHMMRPIKMHQKYLSLTSS